MREILNTFNSQNLVEHPTMKGFYQVPGCSNYYLSREGRVFSCLRKKVLQYIKKKPSVIYLRLHLIVVLVNGVYIAAHGLL